MRLFLASLTLAVALAITACGRLAGGGGAATAAPFDQQFIDMMVPHHQGAVEMARIARQRAQRPEIRTLAAKIAAAQEREIAHMPAWRRAWYGA